MSLNCTAVNKRLLSNALTGVTADAVVLVSFWIKPLAAFTPGSTNTLVELSANTGGGAPTTEGRYGNTLQNRVVEDGSVTSGGNSTTDVWNHWLIESDGRTGASGQRRIAVNGGSFTGTNRTIASNTSTMSSISIGGPLSGSGLQAGRGLLSNVGIWVGQNTTTRDSLKTQLQTIRVDLVTPTPLHAWLLANGALTTAAVGGITLSDAGAATGDADEPTLSGGGGGGDNPYAIFAGVF